MNVVIYARFSSSKQNETSIEAQLEECYNFCKRNEYNVITEYIDRATSAKTDNRPEFQRMITDSNKKNFNAIICYQLDRFARNRYDSATYKAKLKKNGVKVLSVKENISDDVSGILIESVLEGMAEYYSAELGQKVKRNMKLNAERGLFNGGYPPLGYKVVTMQYESYSKKKLEIDNIMAPVIKEIFEMRANDTKILDIVDYLNLKGYKTIQGNEFKRTSLQQILKNKRYIGTTIYGGIEYPKTIPAIIDEELFNKVQKIIDKHRYAHAISKAKEEYLLTTKLFCGTCKESMIGISGTSQTGTVYNYYSCNGVKKKKCKRKNISKHYIEDMVVQECRTLLTEKNIDMIAKKVFDICQKENSQSCLIKALEKQIRDLERNINNLMSAIEKGQNLDLINERLTTNRLELGNAKQQFEIEKKRLINLTEPQIKFFLFQMRNGNADNIKYRKTLINIFINRIYLYDEKLTIIFNVGSEKITVNAPLLNEINKNIKETKNLFLGKLGQPNSNTENIKFSVFFNFKGKLQQFIFSIT